MDEQTEITPKKPRRPPSIRLTKVGHVRDELAKVYREARNGDLGTNEAGKLTYILMAIKSVIETGDLEKRLEALEQGQEKQHDES